MITKQDIENTYRRYKSAPASPDMLDLATLFEHTIENHNIWVDNNELVIESIAEDSPFHSIPMRRIHGIANFERQVAVVLPNAIIFLNKKDEGVHVHIRMPKLSVMDRVRQTIRPTRHPDF